TGGVGDGTTLLVVPLLAAAGAVVVKLSGRGLGHTGGTVDKLEAVPGLRTDLAPEQLLAVAGEVGCVVGAQSDRMVPADRALYALRHATGTVADPALIASSVMAKKLAGGAGTIVLDVKAGDGAFLPGTDVAVALARLCVRIAVEADRRCVALVTAMDQPLGRAVGNALEVTEAVELLGAPPAGRLAALALDLAAEAVALARGGAVAQARQELCELWDTGAGLARLRAMVHAQGGDPAVCDDPRAVLPQAPVQEAVPADRAGWVRAVPARAVGELAARLGAGRRGKADPVDPAVGLVLAVEVGDRMAAGQPLGVVHARTERAARDAAGDLRELVVLADRPVSPPATVLHRISP
ncbi:MAG: thymidine phosphorylase, partial [Egibacteraceae bacterium]